jgi:hypothetical protein
LVTPVWHLRLFTADLILHSFDKAATAERESAFCLDVNDSTANRSELNYLYYTATAKQLFMRVKADPFTYDPIGEPELVGGGRMFDDFCIDQDDGFAYLTTHRQNTIDLLSLEPSRNTNATCSVVGDPFTDHLIGPSAGTWGRMPGEYGRTAYFSTDGGTASPPEGGVHTAKLVRVEFLPEEASGD